MPQTYLLSSIGLPGSGKSTFFARFASEQRCFHWQSDEARRRMFDHPRHTHEENTLLNRASYYTLEQLLTIGTSCLFDVNLNRRTHRRQLDQLAESRGAQFWLLWFQVPLEVAQQRTRQRADQATGELKAYYDTFVPNFVEKVGAQMQTPAPNERVIVLDGAAPYAKQAQTVLARLQS